MPGTSIQKKFQVMVLDDNKDLLEVISSHLTELGHSNIHFYESVADAKKSLIEHEYDLMLLDWNLGDGTCFDLIDYIESHSQSTRTRNAKKIIITGRSGLEDILILLRYGIKDYILKPFNFNEFEATIGPAPMPKKIEKVA